MLRLRAAYRRPIFLSLILFGINLYICRELFTIEFLNNLSTNDGTFISVARFYQHHGTGHGWFPWFNAGMPIENAYQPLLPAMAAIAAKLSGWPIARAFHFVLAFFYCLGPVTLFWFAWEWSESLAIAFIAGLAYSLTSPAELLVPVLRMPGSGVWGGLRLFNLIRYAEDPHNVALALLPLAFLFLRRAIVRRTLPNIAGAILSCASVVAANGFGAIDLVICGLCMVLVLKRGLAILLSVGLAAYLWISPMLPPSLIDLMRHDQFSAHGLFNSGARTWLSALAVIAVFALLWLGLRINSGLERFSILFGFWMCIITLGFFLLNLTLVNQGSRYQLEMEMAICLWFACLCGHIPWRTSVIVIVLIAGVWQAASLRRFARTLIQPVDIAGTIEYKVVTWLDRNLPGQRAMVSGDPEFLYNVLSDNPQMSGGHEPLAPNWEQRVATFTIYSGLNAGGHDAEYSLLWLKAFGNQAIYVAGEKSREHYHAVANPHKFDGLLPVLWHEEDDTIFAIPQRSRSLAHVIPATAIVSREPIHGLDVDPLRPYVAALDDASLPAAEIRWERTAHAVIHAPMKPDQVISVQVTYAPGWHATVAGRPIPVRRDGIDLMVLEPGCTGACEIHLDYGLTTEAWICRAVSWLMTFALIAMLWDAVSVTKHL